MFTTTISVINIYDTSSVVIVPIIWLCIIVVVVVISFSVIVSCRFISLLLVTVGIMYTSAGSSISAIISILFDGENISFDASLVMYINNTSIPPIMIMNRMYENQNLLYIVALIRHTIVVWTDLLSIIRSLNSVFTATGVCHTEILKMSKILLVFKISV
jgi:hypothetical protein